MAEQLHDGSEQFNVIILTKEIQRSLDDIAVSEDLHVLVQCTEMIEEDIDEDQHRNIHLIVVDSTNTNIHKVLLSKGLLEVIILTDVA